MTLLAAILLYLTVPSYSFMQTTKMPTLSVTSYLRILHPHTPHNIPIKNHFPKNPHNSNNLPRIFLERSSSSSSASNNSDETSISTDKTSSKLWLAPLWTILAATVGILASTQPFITSTIGTLWPLQMALAILMLAMGLTTTPQELQAATKQPLVLTVNALFCFGIVPALSVGLASLLKLDSSQRVGTIVLGCVSGGQASNLFTLLAGGDVALSVVCTLSTTLLGVVATPFLIQSILAASIPVQAAAMLKSIVSLVLAPLASGLLLGRLVSDQRLKKIRQLCPTIGLAATLLLVAGGASNAARSLKSSTSLATNLLVSFLLPILSGALAWMTASSPWISQTQQQPSAGGEEATKRALVIEVLSKSPTLAHVLALRHFGVAAAAIPAAAMVSLAVVGALVASLWQRLDPK